MKILPALISLLACHAVAFGGEATAIIGYSDTLPSSLKAKNSGHFKFAILDKGVLTDAGAPATARASVKNGAVSAIVVENQGRAYQQPPPVTISGNGTGAAAVAVVSDGRVTGIQLTAKGRNYTSSPTVIIGQPEGNISHVTLWSNDGTSVDGSEPKAALQLDVAAGAYTAHLGDTSYGPAMLPLPDELPDQDEIVLRVWYAAKAAGPFALLSPDQKLGASRLALRALRADTANEASRSLRADVADGIAPGVQIASSNLGAGAVGAEQLAQGALSAWKQPDGPAFTAQPNQAYLVPPGTESVITLPTGAKVGEVVKVRGDAAKVVAPDGHVLLGSGYHWTPRALPVDPEIGSAYVSGVACSASGARIYARTENAVFRSVDSAKTWKSVLQWDSYGPVFCSSDGMTVVATDGSSEIRRSRDGGESWSVVTTLAGTEEIYLSETLEMSADGSVLAFSDGANLHVSRDAGDSWQIRTPPQSDAGVSRVSLSGSGAVIYAVHEGNDGPILSVSKNHGESWSVVALPEASTHVDYPYAAFVSRDGQRITVFGYAEDPEGLTENYQVRWFSANAGSSWQRTALEPYAPSWADGSPIASGGDARSFFAADVDDPSIGDTPMAITFDAGVSWKLLYGTTLYAMGLYPESIACSDHAQRLLVAADGQLFTSWSDSSSLQGNDVTLTYIGNGNWLQNWLQ